MKVFLLLFLCPLILVEGKRGTVPARVGKYLEGKPNIGLVTFSLRKLDHLTKTDKQRLLDIHNALRSYLARGKETYSSDGAGGFTRMPEAADMQAMSWDDNLATYAQNWANKCQGTTHSSLKGDPLLSAYSLGFLAESMAGDVTSQERDLYGEVKDWNYENFACKRGHNCGHYLSFANAQFNHIGCGFKHCSKNANGIPSYTVVCVYGGNVNTAKEEHKDRLPWQHEYTSGAPCSKCQQGWDYCMQGLCATKQQCGSEPDKRCKCLHKESTCEANGGKFDASACTCECKPEKMGINCALTCADTKEDCGGCGTSASEAYVCEKSCGSCGKEKSAAYNWAYVARTAPNSEDLVTRARMEDVAAPGDPKGQKYCKNSGKNETCEILKERGYCNDFMFGTVVKGDCLLSCSNQPCKKPDEGLKESDFTNLLGSLGGGGGSTGSSGGDLGSLGGPAKGTDAASGLAASGFGNLGSLGDLSGFKFVRRRRR